MLMDINDIHLPTEMPVFIVNEKWLDAPTADSAFIFSKDHCKIDILETEDRILVIVRLKDGN